MTFTSNYRLGPSTTPKSLKFLIGITLVINLFCAVANHLFPYYLGWPSPQQLMSLSNWGIHNLFLWQIISYLFVHPIGDGVSFSFLLSMAFNLYLLWVIGSSVIERKGNGHFFALYFLSGALAGCTVFALESLSHSPVFFAGNGATLYALLISWIVLFPRAELMLFLTLPIRASWLILGILGINLLIDLSTGDWIRVIGYASAAAFGYIYSSIFWKEKESSPPLYSHAKRFDFRTGKAILNDEEFLEAMLTKISMQGKSSLSWKERWRLRNISKRKKKR
jgi:membrane associated rhomboid family serine protease